VIGPVVHTRHRETQKCARALPATATSGCSQPLPAGRIAQLPRKPRHHRHGGTAPGAAEHCRGSDLESACR
jgi:hypothetical protein